MAISKKGLRKITFSQEVFLWKIKKKASHNERHDNDYEIPIQYESGGQILLACVGFCRSQGYGREPMEITPSLISSCITEAIGLGWKHKEPEKPIRLIDGKLITWEALNLEWNIYNQEIDKLD